MLTPILTPRDKAERYHRALPEHIRQYLKNRGIPATIIDRQLLGWNGERVTIPIFDGSGKVLAFRYARPPADLAGPPEMVSDEGAKPELYGWETLARQPYRVIICEGELDRLVLEARGFPAVTSTGGTAAFFEEWVLPLREVNEVYVCFKRGRASDAAAQRVQALLPAARVAHLPEEGGVSDFFQRPGRESRDFEIVLAEADGAGDNERAPDVHVLRPVHRALRKRAERLRKEVRLHDLVSESTTLQASGRNLVGHCPLHDDRSLSFTVYLSSDTYRCSECGAQGDIVTFLMDKESMTFGQALEALERFEFTHDLYRAC